MGVQSGRSGRAAPPSVVLGLSTGFHDAAACLLVDGVIAAAVEQERLSRAKHDAAFPADAAATCLAVAGLAAHDVDVVAVHEKPVLVLQRYLATRMRSGPRGLPALARGFPGLVRSHLAIGRDIEGLFARMGAPLPPISWVEHHASHAAAAFFASPFDHAAVLTADGVGEWATASIAHGAHHRVTLAEELRFPDSLGMLYSAFTAYCGFRVNSGEGELMGLAPYGTPRYADLITEHLLDVHDDGSFAMDQRYFAYVRGSRMTSNRFHRLFGGPPRPRGAEPTQREADLAASVQSVTERLLVAMARHACDLTGERRLCLAGGVALNCVANGRVAREADLDGLWIQPAAGDAGGALGAALHTWHEDLGQHRRLSADGADAMRGSLLGPSFTTEEVHRHLDELGVAHEVLDPHSLSRRAARLLDSGATLGVLCGPMEYGPRALGARSIIADPRAPHMQDRLNRMVKDRQAFRPFAPAVLAEEAHHWFDLVGSSPYMLQVGSVRPEHLLPVTAEPDDLEARTSVPRSTIPACTHVDGSARVQTVDDRHPSLRRLLTAFHELTGCPVLLNTSFNGRDEPIVCTPDEALRTARRIGLDAVALEGCLVTLEAA